MIKFITNTKIEDLHPSILGNEKIQISSLEELWEWRKGRSQIFLDTETNTLDYRTGNLLLRQFGNREIQFVLDWTVELDKSFYEDVTFVIHNVVFDYNQLKRDKIVLNKVYDTMLAMMVCTTGMYTDDYIKEERPYRLEQLVLDSCGHQLSKFQRSTFADFNISRDRLTDAHIIYAAEDVQYLDIGYEYVHSKIIEYDLEDCINLENRYVLAFADMKYNGVKLDEVKWLDLVKKKTIERDEMFFDIDDALTFDIPEIVSKSVGGYRFENPAYYQADLFSSYKKRRLAVNYNSSQQVTAILKYLGLDIKDKHGKQTTDIKELKKIKSKSKFIETYIKLKELEKKISSFGVKYLQFIDPTTRRIHFGYGTQILNTGRTSLEKPNLYQVPRENDYRNCFIGEEKDGYKYYYVGGDYSAQEGRIMADASGDEDYINFFNNGDGDPHSFVATKMFSAQYGRQFLVSSKTLKVEIIEGEDEKQTFDRFVKLSKLKKPVPFTLELINDIKFVVISLEEGNEWRQNGKILNFFLSFGGSAYTLAMQLGLPIQECEALVKAFFDGFPTLKAMFNRFANFAITNGYAVTNPIIKRKRWFSEWNDMNVTGAWISEQKEQLGQHFWDQLKDKSSLLSKENRKNYKIKGDIERAGQNTPIQGTAADMSKMALVFNREKLIENGILPFDDAVIKIILMPHDEIQNEAREDYLELSSQIIADSMDEAGKIFVKSISLRPKVEVNPYWKK